MTTSQKIDALSDNINKRFDEHDQNFIDLGDIFVGLSHKIDTVIRLTSDLPVIRDDIKYLKKEAAHSRNQFKKIDEQFIKMEAKNDYMLGLIEKISARQYA